MQKLIRTITTGDLNEKIEIASSLINEPVSPILKLTDTELFKIPGRPAGFQITHPRSVPKRNFRDSKNRSHFLHAIANIELLAIELPALCLLRFGSNNESFIKRQFQIIAEEAKHFSLLKDRLHDLGCEFGSVPVHIGLWDYAWRCKSELEHQIIIPCYLEARGLDVTPDFIKKFNEVEDPESAAIMQIILNEEVHHVKMGIEYMEQIAEVQNTTASKLYEKTLKNFFGDKIKSKIPINRHYRKLAGFNDEQISMIED